MTLPVKFRKSAEPALANYDYTDLAEGTGIQTFYGCDIVDSAGTSYVLLTEAIPASDGETAEIGGPTTRNFDLTQFNLSKTVTGTGYFQSAILGAATGMTLKAKLQKWDGTTATDITSQFTSTNPSGVSYKFVFFKMPCTKTHFKKGDILRLQIVTEKGGAGTGYFVHQPTGAATANFAVPTNVPSTIMRVLVPFKIDV